MSGLSVQPDRRKGPFEQAIQSVIDLTVVPMAKTIGFVADHGILFLVFAALWLAFGVAVLANQAGLDSAWTWIGSLPLILQGILWLLFLPVVGGLWVWESGWPMIARLLIVVSLAGWNLLVFLPRANGASQADA